MPSAAARFARIASRYGSSFGFCAITVTSTFDTAIAGLAHAVATAPFNSSMLLAPFHCGSVSGKHPADVAGAGGAEHRVGHRVAHDVGVGVAVETKLERNRDAARGSAGGPATSRCKS